MFDNTERIGEETGESSASAKNDDKKLRLTLKLRSPKLHRTSEAESTSHDLLSSNLLSPSDNHHGTFTEPAGT